MELHYFQKNGEVVKIEERLKNMTLAYKEHILEEEKLPFFKDGKKEYHGIEK